MAYPEKGANYDHKPRFVERMKRAEGGAADEPLEPLQNTAEKYEDGGTYLQKMRNDEGGRGLSDWRGSFGNNEKVAPMPIVTGTDTGDNMDADTSANQPSFLRGRKPLNHGGRVRRADGGPTNPPPFSPLKIGGASIERERDGSFSVYRPGNPYATTGGFKSPDEAAAAVTTKRDGGRVRKGD